MTSPNDYPAEMPRLEITDEQVEELLVRRASSAPELAKVAAALDQITLERLDVNLEHTVGRYSMRAAAIASQGKATKKKTWLASLTPRLAGAALTVVLLAGMTGVAVAANYSAPGDFLYGLDRAMESVGLADGGIPERLDEAHVVAGRGQSAAALDHVADALSRDWSEAADALHRAAHRVGVGPNTKEDVAEMLEWMATTTDESRAFGQGVADRARGLGAGADEPSSAGGDSETAPEKGRGRGGANAGGNAGDNSNAGGNGNGAERDNNRGGSGPPGGSPPGRAGK